MDNENMHIENTGTENGNAAPANSLLKLPNLDFLYQTSDDRFQDFLKNSKVIYSLLYNKKDYQPNIIKRTFTEKLTKNPKEGNMEAIKKLIYQDNGAKSLIIAPTGSGKTYSIDAIFKQIADESSGKELLCLLCPNRVQNIQNEKSDDYNFEALIEGISLEDNGKDIRQISAVYDKLPEIRKYKKEHPDCKLRVVIDECHTLISANLFREQAISSIMRLIQSGEADSYTFITATYENMCVFPFDNIMIFEDKNYKPVFKSIDIRFAKRNDLDNLIMSTALNESKPFIRLNSGDRIKRLDKTLSDMGVNSQTVTADDKGYRTNDDGTVTYNNVIFDHIVNHDDLYNNEGEADVIFATSLLDAGTNFTKYSPDSTPVFVVFSEKIMNLDEIEQSFNRFRPQKDENGDIIQLDHAVILHQIPDHAITQARIAKHDSDGKSYSFSTIPPMAISYKDQTTPEEKEKGYYNGVITIAGKYFEKLETGKYVLELTIGEKMQVLPVPLYVNCQQEGDIDSLSLLMEKLTGIWKNDYFQDNGEVNPAAHTLMLDTINDISTISETRMREKHNYVGGSFFLNYHTGDESVSCLLPKKPFPVFFPITSIFEDCQKELIKWIKRFYKEKDNDEMDFYEMGGKTEKQYLEDNLNIVKLKDAYGVSNALYISDSPLRLWFDHYKLFNIAYNKYQNLYYYYPEYLKNELQKRLNIPVSISYPVIENYSIKKIQDDRASLINSLNILYKNPLTKDILCDVLHHSKKIPADLDKQQREMLSDIIQSKLYKKEYLSVKKSSPAVTFDYIIKVLNFYKSERDISAHCRRLDRLYINKKIAKEGKLPLATKGMRMQFTEQSTLISVINDRKQSKGSRKLTLSDTFMESLRDEYNRRMKEIIPAYTPKGEKKFKELLYSVYIVINKDIKSRKPELTELILRIEDVPFIID